MAGIFALSIDPFQYKGDFAQDLFLGTIFGQHRNEIRCGFTSTNGQNIEVCTAKGLIKPNFEGQMSVFKGIMGMGYCGCFKEPFRVQTKFGPISICYSGEVSNYGQLLRRLSADGSVFRRSDPIEAFANLIVRERDLVSGMQAMHDKISGSFALFVLTPAELLVTLSPNSQQRPVVGRKEGVVAIASESCGFSNLGLVLCGEIRPGQVCSIKNTEVLERAGGGGGRFCSLQWVDLAFPTSIIAGVPVSLVKKNLGKSLAKKDMAYGFCPDIVTYPPNSGRFHGFGYQAEFVEAVNAGRVDRIPLVDELFHKYPFFGRSRVYDTGVEKPEVDNLKLLCSAEKYEGKTVVLCKDSLTTGSQTKEGLVPKLRSLGVKEIHLRVSNPIIFHHCRWREEDNGADLLARKFKTEAEMANYLGVETVVFNTPDELLLAIKDASVGQIIPQSICTDCSESCDL